MTAPRLKPCPFCGAGPEFLPVVWKHNGSWSVGCNNCLSWGPVKDSLSEANSAWNRRAKARRTIDREKAADRVMARREMLKKGGSR